jgi:hypothetical protein
VEGTTHTTGHAFVDALVIVGVSVLISLSVLKLVRRTVPHHVLMPHNDVAGFVYATIGVAHAVVLAFILIATWEQFDSAKANADHEADAVEDLYNLAEGLPDPSHQAIQAVLLDYAHTVVNDEWPAMTHRTDPSPEAEEQVAKLWQAFRATKPENPTQQAIYQESLTRLNNFTNLRQERLIDSRGGILDVMWFVLIAGAALTVLFPCVFGVENGRIHALIITALATSLGLLLFLTYDLNHPFQGDIHVQPVGFHQLLDELGPATGTDTHA